MPVSVNHVVHVGDSAVPPTIALILRPTKRSKDIAIGGETWEREWVMVRTRIDDSRRVDSEQAREHLRPATTSDLYQPGQFVQVPDDPSGNAVFLGPADPDETASVESPHTATGRRNADVANVRHSDGSIKQWPYSKITPAV